MGGFGGLSGLGFGPFGAFPDVGSGVGVGASMTAGSGVGLGVGSGAGAAGTTGAGLGDGLGRGAGSLLGATRAAAGAFVRDGFGFDADGSPGDALGDSGRTRIESSRGGRVVIHAAGVVTSVRASTGTGTRSTATIKPPSGMEGARAGGVTSRPRTPPIANPTRIPTIDWIDFESMGGLLVIRGTTPDYPYLDKTAPAQRPNSRDSAPDRSVARPTI